MKIPGCNLTLTDGIQIVKLFREEIWSFANKIKSLCHMRNFDKFDKYHSLRNRCDIIPLYSMIPPLTKSIDHWPCPTHILFQIWIFDDSSGFHEEKSVLPFRRCQCPSHILIPILIPISVSNPRTQGSTISIFQHFGIDHEDLNRGLKKVKKDGWSRKQ